MVFAHGAPGNCVPVECRQLVRADRCFQSGRRRHAGEPYIAHAAPDTVGPRPADGATFKYIYLASFGSYYTFYLMSRFNLSVRSAQIHLFLFLGAVAAGTIFGGPIGDRFGRRRVILWSILGVLPFSLALPYVDLFWTRALSIVIGLILASAFSAIIVYAQELVPGRVGTISGLFFGLAFGIAGIGAAVLGELADRTSISTVYLVCSYLPAIGVLGFWLPRIEKQTGLSMA